MEISVYIYFHAFVFHYHSHIIAIVHTIGNILKLFFIIGFFLFDKMFIEI